MQHPKRRQDTAAFRHEAVRLITAHGYGVPEAARSLGINTKMWGRWKRPSEPHRYGGARGNGHLSAAHDELVRLRQAVTRLRLERESVKKAALFFAHEARGETPALRRRSSAGRSRCCVRCWTWGAAGFMTTNSAKLPPRSVTKRSTCLSVSKRYQKRRITVMVVVVWSNTFRTRGMTWVASRCVG